MSEKDEYLDLFVFFDQFVCNACFCGSNLFKWNNGIATFAAFKSNIFWECRSKHCKQTERKWRISFFRSRTNLFGCFAQKIQVHFSCTAFVYNDYLNEYFPFGFSAKPLEIPLVQIVGILQKMDSQLSLEYDHEN